MRYLFLIAIAVALAGCAASRQEVASKLGQEFIGQNVDALILRFGPPSSTFRLNSGGGSYVWQLSAVTDIEMDRGYGTASTRSCKVSVATNPSGIVTDLNTEDPNAGAGLIGTFGGWGSMCAQRLGMKRTT